MPEVPHDATVALRLELGRMTDKANALESALRKEVAAVIRDEIAKAKPKKMYDTKPDGTICIVAEDEEIAALKAEVEHIKFWNGQLKAESDRLKAEVERLRKAGDAMADFFVPDIDDLGHNYGFKKSVESVISNWRAAKEGKPSV